MEHGGDFVHPPNPLVEENLQSLKKKVRASGADFGICFDGDADRVVVVDDTGAAVRSDILAALLARRMLAQARGSTVVYDLRSSRVVAEEIKANGGVPRRERAGAAFIKKALAESKGVFAGDVVGRYYFQDNGHCESGLLAMVEVINMLTQEGKAPSELVKPLMRYASSGQRDFVNPDADATLRRMANTYEDARVDFLDGVTVQYEDWWFNVRKSASGSLLRLNLEAATPELMQQKLDEVSSQLGTPASDE
jgi:phosphomannomutase